jgi:hypothetical protein
MAARNTNVSVAAKTWTALTDGDVTGNITFQIASGTEFYIKATTDGTEPTNLNGALRYRPGEGETGKTIAEIFPGLTSPDRLWAYGTFAGAITVSHGT